MWSGTNRRTESGDRPLPDFPRSVILGVRPDKRWDPDLITIHDAQIRGHEFPFRDRQFCVLNTRHGRNGCRQV
jgi:hypothetical protein